VSPGRVDCGPKLTTLERFSYNRNSTVWQPKLNTTSAHIEFPAQYFNAVAAWKFLNSVRNIVDTALLDHRDVLHQQGLACGNRMAASNI
jgi:hypothetical protein